MVVAVMGSVKAAEMAELMDTPVVGPGMVVAGTLRVTRGRVVSGVRPVVKVHT
jgi:hypothetical protein